MCIFPKRLKCTLYVKTLHRFIFCACSLYINTNINMIQFHRFLFLLPMGHWRSCRFIVLPVNWELVGTVASSVVAGGSWRMCTGRSTVNWECEEDASEPSGNGKSPFLGWSSCNNCILTPWDVDSWSFTTRPSLGRTLAKNWLPFPGEGVPTELMPLFFCVWSEEPGLLSHPFCFLFLASWMAL